MQVLVVGSRGSELALRQTSLIIERLSGAASCRVQVIKTTGDNIQDVPLAKIGDKGLFVREIEQALLRGEIDFAVHSAKDLPSEMDNSLCIAAYPAREDPSDVLVSKQGSLAELASGARVGTSSLRRRVQLLHARPDLRIIDLRGNLDTRLRKLDGPDYDAIVLARAGLKRLGLESEATQILPFDVCLPAVGQGALAIQCRVSGPAFGIIEALDHSETRACVTAERALMARLDAGCQTPLAALARVIEGKLRLDAVVVSVDGSEIVRMSDTGEPGDAVELGLRVAEKLLGSRARELLNEARRAGEQKQ